MNSLVSVIIPVYNVEKYLDECIQSVIHQTYKTLEIILIDDGSTDSSNSICKKYLELDNRIQLIEKSNGGQASARNKGIDIAKGKYIYFLDSDDMIKPTMIEEVLSYMESNNADLCYFSAELLLESDYKNWDINMYTKRAEYNSDTGVAVLMQLVEHNEYTCQNCMFITKSNLIKDNSIRYTEGYIYEDNYFAFMLAINSRKSCVMNNDLYIRRVREGSTMTENSVLEKRIYAYKQVLEDFNNIKSENKDVNFLLKKFKRGFVFSIIKFIEQINDKKTKKGIYKYLSQNFYFRDIKLYCYLQFRRICQKLNIKDPFCLIK